MGFHEDRRCEPKAFRLGGGGHWAARKRFEDPGGGIFPGHVEIDGGGPVYGVPARAAEQAVAIAGDGLSPLSAVVQLHQRHLLRRRASQDFHDARLAEALGAKRLSVELCCQWRGQSLCKTTLSAGSTGPVVHHPQQTDQAPRLKRCQVSQVADATFQPAAYR